MLNGIWPVGEMSTVSGHCFSRQITVSYIRKHACDAAKQETLANSSKNQNQGLADSSWDLSGFLCEPVLSTLKQKNGAM